jgi:DNA invertase Pin-like site-specific DNA recombinase
MTAGRRFVDYYRVSTQQQGRSGLGLAAQQEAVQRHLAAVAGDLVDAFEEVETGKLNSRLALAQALAACRAMHGTLIIAKLDRLARNAAFLLSVVEGSGQGGVVFCDLPQVPPGSSGKFVIAIMAAVAELEAGLISERTQVALAQAKARGGQARQSEASARHARAGPPGGSGQASAGRRSRGQRAAQHRAGAQGRRDHPRPDRRGTERQGRAHGARRSLVCGHCVARAGPRCWAGAAQ